MEVLKVYRASYFFNKRFDLSNLSPGGVDYEPLNGVEVTFNPGVFTQTVSAVTLTDIPAEENEMFFVDITGTEPVVTVFNPRASVTISEEGLY